MEGSGPGHDRDTGVPDRATTPVATGETSERDNPVGAGSAPSAALQIAIERLRLQGAVFLRAEYREPWAYESFSGPATAALLRPGTERVILFHVVASGTCWVTVDDGPKHWAQAGDVIVLPYGDQHRMGGVDEAETVSIETSLDAPPWSTMPVLRHGADGSLTDVVCGYLHSGDPLLDPELRVFPSVFVVRPTATAANSVQANTAFALQQTAASPSRPSPGTTRLPELLLIEVLRMHLATAYPPRIRGGRRRSATRCWRLRLRCYIAHRGASGRCRSSRGPLRSRGHCSTLASAKYSVVHRTAASPSGACTSKQDLLATTDFSIVGVAHRVGYEAEESVQARSRFRRPVFGAPRTRSMSGSQRDL